MATSEPKATFLNLPYEIRVLIYTITISDPPTFNTYDQNPPLHSMLLVNRQIHDEYAKIYYGSNIFHLYMRRRTADDYRTPDTSGLAKWRSRSPSMLSCIREVMIHFDIFFRSKVPDADRSTPSDVRWLAAGLAMALNIEILHIVLFCTQPAVRTMPSLYLSSTGMFNDLTMTNHVLKAIPWIKDCCKASTLPNLLRVVLHVDATHGNKTVSCFTENMEGCEWVKSFSKSLVSCDNTDYSGWGSHFSEHIFKIHG
jgi:hypothetical protein